MALHGWDVTSEKHQDIIDSQFARLCHVVRAVVGLAALLSTCGYLLLFVRHRHLRTTLNWAICNLLVSNGLLALFIAIFSTLKAIDANSLNRPNFCLGFTWVITFLTFAPSWSVVLLALVRAVQFSNSDRLTAFLSLRFLFITRILIVLTDAIVTCVILYDKSNLVVSTQCTYQLMLEASAVYMIYTLLIIILLVVSGLSALLLRLRCRRQMMAAAQGAPTAADPQEEQSGSAEGLVQTRSVPVNLFKKPPLLLLACLLVFLFTLPRTAFFIDSNELWQLSTLCPVIIAFILPPAFIYYAKDCRVAFGADLQRCLVFSSAVPKMEENF